MEGFHTGYRAARWIVTALYFFAVGFSFAWTLDGRGMAFPVAALMLTTSDALLMLLLWLHDRFPPPR